MMILLKRVLLLVIHIEVINQRLNRPRGLLLLFLLLSQFLFECLLYLRQHIKTAVLTVQVRKLNVRSRS